MTYAFNKLSGFQRTPPGIERNILRGLPRVTLLGSLMLCLPSLLARLWWAGAFPA